MLAMRSKLLLEAMDELGHSYDLQRALGFGYIDFEGEEGWEGGDPNDCLPPGIDNPLELPQPGDPGYVPPEPQPGDPDYIPPIPQPGDPGYIPPQPGDPDYIPPSSMPGDPDYIPPMPGDPDYIPPVPGDPDYIPPDSVPGDPDYIPPAPGDPDYIPPQPGDLDYVPPAPLPGDPDYTGPMPGDPDYVGPAPQPGDPGYTGPLPGDPGYVPPAPLPGEPGYIPPAPGDPGYVPPQPGDPGYFPPCPQPGDPDYGPPMPGEDGYSLSAEANAEYFALVQTLPRFGFAPGHGLYDHDPAMIAWPGSLFGGDTGGKTSGTKNSGASGPNCCLHSDGGGGTVLIGYTTQQMAANEEQALTVDGYIDGCAAQNYQWEITSGGGSLSADHGWGVTYTAPATNPNCEENPTISLSCGGEVVDTLSIAINALNQYNAYRAVTESPIKMGYYCGYTWNFWHCNGEVRSHSEADSYCCDPGNTCPWTVGDWPGSCVAVCPSIGEVLEDTRTPEQIAGGCCPEALL